VPTFEEYLDVALSADRAVGVYPETKHPTWHDGLGIFKGTTLSDLVLDALKAKGYKGAVGSKSWAQQPVFIQSFEVRFWIKTAGKMWLSILLNRSQECSSS
jgi:glycerophosphoryl diester phosphodiesterase